MAQKKAPPICTPPRKENRPSTPSWGLYTSRPRLEREKEKDNSSSGGSGEVSYGYGICLVCSRIPHVAGLVMNSAWTGGICNGAPALECLLGREFRGSDVQSWGITRGEEVSYFGVRTWWLGNIVETRWLDVGRFVCGYKGSGTLGNVVN